MDNMQHIGSALEQTIQNIKVNTSDPVARHGFTQVPNFILKNSEISPGAKVVYSLLLSYAWSNNCCFPGQERLAEHAGLSKRSVVSFMSELENVGLIDVQRRGLGKTNFYTINFTIRSRGKK